MVLKLDLVKAYDRVDWGFLRLILLQIGLDLDLKNWSMTYLPSVNYVVLINGTPTNFFRGTNCVRQGFPLSPLLFLLIIEVFSQTN